MAEGVLDGVVGGESPEGGGAGAAQTQARAEAFAAAIVAKLGGADPKVAHATEAFLERQAHLLDLQAKAITDEHDLRMGQLRGNARESKLRRVGQRIRIALQLFSALVIVLIGLGLLLMVYDAFASRSVIVEPFDAPPALAARGITGKVVAGGLLDQLARLQSATRSSAAKRNLSSAWTGDIKVEVPKTGVSIGEIQSLLKERFGHDIHIDGDLVQTDAGGLALSVRGDKVLPKTFTGAAGDLDKLTSQAAEYIYGQSEPSIFAIYLNNAGRSQETVDFSKANYAVVARAEKPFLLNAWANALLNTGGSQADALVLYREALKLKPDFWVAYNNVMNSTWGLGDEEGAWRVGEAMAKAAGGRPGKAPENLYQNWDAFTWSLQAWRDAEIADAQANGGLGTGTTSDATAIIDADARMHDAAATLFEIKVAKSDEADPSIPAMDHFGLGLLALDAHDAARAVAELEAFQAAYANPIVSSNYPGYLCWVAPAEAMAGHPDKADAAITAGGRFVDCYRFKADMLDARGDWAGAQRGYAAAVALAPDLPAGYYSWGLALARHGDLPGAVAKLKLANARGPRWADPLKAWGDVLARQGDWPGALRKYRAAEKYAPAWTALQQAQAVAERHS